MNEWNLKGSRILLGYPEPVCGWQAQGDMSISFSFMHSFIYSSPITPSSM